MSNNDKYIYIPINFGQGAECIDISKIEKVSFNAPSKEVSIRYQSGTVESRDFGSDSDFVSFLEQLGVDKRISVVAVLDTMFNRKSDFDAQKAYNLGRRLGLDKDTMRAYLEELQDEV